MENIKIIKCGINDWQILLQIGFQTFSDSFEHKNTPDNFNDYISKAFTENKIKMELQDPHSHFYFIYKKDELAGYLKLNELGAQTEPQGNSAIEIERIYLYKKFQGKGLGKYIMEFAFQLAKEKKNQKYGSVCGKKTGRPLHFMRNWVSSNLAAMFLCWAVMNR